MDRQRRRILLTKYMRQRLGQHFLKDHSVLENIVASLEIKKNEVVIEIGPGHGELTQYLLAAYPKRLIAIEKDPDLADKLVESLEGTEIEVVKGDVLKVLPETVSRLNGKPYKLVGNIPYYITGYLMRTLEKLEPKPERTILLIQKEVAERICSEPPRMNLLAASVQFWGIARVVGSVNRSAFEPRPDVDSAIISIDPKPLPNDLLKEGYYKLVKALFRQPRKTILNNLREGLDMAKTDVESKLNSADVSPGLRPGNLDIGTIAKLSRVFLERA